MNLGIKILPSLLAADFGCLRDGARLAEAAGADELHIDIMDGHFVPNLSMGPDVVSMARRCVSIPLSVHLMMTNPDRHIEKFIEAGADTVLVHIEVECDIPAVLRRIRELGAHPGITLNPETPPDAVFPVLSMVDSILCMTVHPGYGGQEFMSEVLPKIRVLRDHQLSRELDILVDGGINVDTAAKCAAYGANVFIAGVALFEKDDMAAEIGRMRRQARNALR